MNKKGFFGVLLIPIIVFTIIISVMAGVILLKAFMEEANLVIPDAYNATITDVSNAISTMDAIAPFVFIGVGIAFIIMSYTIQTHPIFYLFGLFIILIGVITTAGLSNAIMEMNETTSEYTGVALPITLGMAQYMPHIFLGIAVIGAIAFYGKYGGGYGQI